MPSRRKSVAAEEYTGPGARAVTGEKVGLPEESVVYVGPFGAREISVKDWEAAGVKDQPAVRWDRGNSLTLPKEAFTENALRVLQADGGFRVT